MKFGGHVACVRNMMNAYKILMGKPEGKKYFEHIGFDRKVV
jgi:hypothetical protein